MFFLHKWKKNLESDIDCMEESMQPYIALFLCISEDQT